MSETKPEKQKKEQKQKLRWDKHLATHPFNHKNLAIIFFYQRDKV